jgi:hypothetical protein
MLPYYSDSEALRRDLAEIPKGSTVIMHQGLQTAYMGTYVQDKTSLPPSAFADYRVISGHYHAAQDIECGPLGSNHVGLFSYVGNPYTLNYGEAQDPPKGYAILYSDGYLERIALNLPRHRVYSFYSVAELYARINQGTPLAVNSEDKIWIKVEDYKTTLAKLDKKTIGEVTGLGLNFKFDAISLDLDPTDATKQNNELSKLTDERLLDSIIESTNLPNEDKVDLKALWRTTNESP